ncbi:MAG: GNAT family N-acetyltransferase [Crocinitomicaceae bacterium]
MQIRSLKRTDLESIKLILDSIELFPSEILNEMTDSYFNDKESKEIWFTAVKLDKPIGFGLCIPELLTEGTYNLVSIGVEVTQQGKGIGQMMMAYLESELMKLKGRLLIVETSGDKQYLQTQAFYQKLGFTKEAIIKGFWQAGEDKIIFSKRLR